MDGGTPGDASEADAGATDAGPLDAGTPDAGSRDAGVHDAGPMDGGPERCNARDDDGDGAVDEDGACAPCTTGAREGSVYLFCPGPAAWTMARTGCTERGYDLVVLESEEEDRWVWSMLDEEAWMGLTDLTSEGTYTWVDGTVAWSEGTAYAYTNWRDGMPEDSPPGDCIQFDDMFSDGLWADDLCSVRLAYACEADAP